MEIRHSLLTQVLIGDGRFYDEWARKIVAGDWSGKEVFLDVPLYPYFVAVLYKTFTPSAVAIRITQAILGSLSCVFLSLAGRRFFSWKTGIMSGCILAVYPPAIFYGALIQKSALDLFFITVFLFLIGEFLARTALWKVTTAGFVLSCFALTRENSLILYPLVAVWLLLHFRNNSLPTRVRWIALFTVGTASLLVITGWHNKITGGTFQPTAASVGVNFYYGNSERSDGRYFSLAPWRGGMEGEHQDKLELAEMEAGRELTMGEMSRFWWDKAWREIAIDPSHWIKLMWTKWALTWNAAEPMDTESILHYREESVLLRALKFLNFGVICPLAMAGVWMTRYQWRQLWILYGIVAGFAAAVALFLVFGRYRFPITPVMILFAASGILHIAGQIEKRSFASLATPLAIAAVIAAISNWPMLSDVEELGVSHSNLGMALYRSGKITECLKEFQTALKKDPTQLSAANNLSWIYATSATSEFRNAKQAIALAEQTCRVTMYRDPMMLDTLAAAYAEAGRFEEAQESATKAIELANGTRDRGLKKRIIARSELYKQRKPYRSQ